jgi:hypothetical protein
MIRELVFTAFNRPYYLQDSIKTWNQARNLRQWNATFYVEPSNIQDQMVEQALQLQTTTTVVVNPERLGVLVNPWNAINDAFERGADFVVIAEDDIAVSEDVLEFFEWTSIEYQGAKSVLCVNAFSGIGGDKQNELMQHRRFSPLVWGTWRDRWEQHLRDSWDKDYSTGKPDGSEAGWDWNINRILEDKQMTVLSPLQSRSDHLGEWGGTHMTPDLYPSSRGIDFVQVRGRSRFKEV